MEHQVTLQRGDITLRPLDIGDAADLRALVDADMWAGNSQPLPATDEAMAALLATQIEDPSSLAFAVVHNERLVGRSILYDLVPRVKVEIGNTIYARAVWGSAVNPTCKLLLLRYCFEDLGVQRVALRCDHRNARSHRAIRRLGARFEGTLRNFRPAADGTLADVDYFSILPDEWPAVRRGLEARLSGAGIAP
ncbi:MAG: GNAT family protein [Brachybacterium sp.]|nr:GNAT family protein [Brachybacterium sp.]